MSRKNFLKCVFGLMMLAGAASFATPNAKANYRAGRQYYGTWTYNPIQRYHYRSYYYKPVTTYTTYSYHYVIYYPSQPRYYYYYNPVSRHYWGRFDREEKGYSMLAEKDRKEKLEDIKESAFPKPAKMPGIPEATDNETIETPPDDAPKDEGKDKK
jgi:hypothetical protein